jgi:hypothetical protein
MVSNQLRIAAANNLAKEYVALQNLALVSMKQALPLYTSEITSAQGTDIWDKMAMDPIIAGNLDILVELTYSEGLSLQLPVPGPKPGKELTGEEKARFELATAIKEDTERNLKALDQDAVIRGKQMLRGMLKYGSKIANVVYRHDLVGGKKWIRDIKPKSRKAVGFHVDEFFNVNGFVANDGLFTGAVVLAIDQVIDPIHFAWMTFGEEDCDPRGHPCFEECYNWWYVKTHGLPAFLKFLHQWGTPSVVGIAGPTPEGGTVYDRDADGELVLDSVGNPIPVDFIAELATELQKLEGGTAIAVQNGAEVKSLFAGQGGADAYERAFNNVIDKQITYRMLGQTRATLESVHGSKADSQTGQDVLGYIVDGLKLLCTQMWRRVLYDRTKVNWGEDVARELTPIPVMNAMPQEDFAANADAISTLVASDFVADEQIPALDAKLGLEPRDMKVWTELREAKNAASQPAAQDGKGEKNEKDGKPGKDEPLSLKEQIAQRRADRAKAAKSA